MDFLKKPKTDFAAVRDGRNSLPLWMDIDLTSARSISAGNALSINIAGNSFYIDQDTANVGNSTVHFQDTNLGNSSAPLFVSAGFIANVPFTQILIENTAQPAKRLRIFYGVDIDFQAGVNALLNVINTSVVRKSFTSGLGVQTVNTTNVVMYGGNASRDYLFMQNQSPSATVYVRFGGAAAIGTGIKLTPGQSLELDNVVPFDSVQVISDTAGTIVLGYEA